MKAAKKNLHVKPCTILHSRLVQVQPLKYDNRQCLEENSLLGQLTNTVNYIPGLQLQVTEWLLNFGRCFVEDKPNANPNRLIVHILKD